VDAPGRRELLLDLLRASPQPRGILSLAEELGVHANTVRFHLETLLRIGQIDQLLGDTTGPGRPPVLFRATHRMDPDGPTNYRLLASMLTSHLAGSSPDPAAAATELGRAWGPHLLAPTTTDPTATGRARRARVKRGEALTRMTSALSDLGFAPEPSTGRRDTTIRLRHCPFLGLVTGTDNGTSYSEVICSLHLGLMQGALASLQGPVTVDRLDPFVEPDLCVAHLAPAATAQAAVTGTASDNDPSPSSR
jgi:predicted ArsR family transcriptional regulator